MVSLLQSVFRDGRGGLVSGVGTEFAGKMAGVLRMHGWKVEIRNMVARTDLKHSRELARPMR
jgi:hypothetical protein